MVQIQTKHSSVARHAKFNLSPRILPSPNRESRPPGVLIVDDDTAVRSMLAFGFRRFGFNVWPAADCQSALEAFRENRDAIDVALLDVLMPGRDGPATLSEIRAIDPHLPACFMTGNSGSYSEQDLFDLDAYAVFWKPITLLEVIEHLRLLANPNVKAAGVVR